VNQIIRDAAINKTINKTTTTSIVCQYSFFVRLTEPFRTGPTAHLVCVVYGSEYLRHKTNGARMKHLVLVALMAGLVHKHNVLADEVEDQQAD
jgi:hypothetical protein